MLSHYLRYFCRRTVFTLISRVFRVLATVKIGLVSEFSFGKHEVLLWKIFNKFHFILQLFFSSFYLSKCYLQIQKCAGSLNANFLIGRSCNTYLASMKDKFYEIRKFYENRESFQTFLKKIRWCNWLEGGFVAFLACLFCKKMFVIAIDLKEASLRKCKILVRNHL